MTTSEFATPLRDAGPPESEPTFGEMLEETVSLLEVIPVYGPPIILVAGPWLIVALMLAGPFAVLLTLVVLLVAAAALVALTGAILAAPFLLVARLLRRREPRALPFRRHVTPRAAVRSSVVR
jgi:hypothetical protein